MVLVLILLVLSACGAASIQAEGAQESGRRFRKVYEQGVSGFRLSIVEDTWTGHCLAIANGTYAGGVTYVPQEMCIWQGE